MDLETALSQCYTFVSWSTQRTAAYCLVSLGFIISVIHFVYLELHQCRIFDRCRLLKYGLHFTSSLRNGLVGYTEQRIMQRWYIFSRIWIIAPYQNNSTSILQNTQWVLKSMWWSGTSTLCTIYDIKLSYRTTLDIKWTTCFFCIFFLIYGIGPHIDYLPSGKINIKWLNP